ncbi:hypothetical protein ACHHYP_00719 [Achlya hypogyna]|uniref:Uncharacterized protein n=1 Tax=Achlya hypogyna TaxID=1202772 RepID=A0A1V9ZTZ8_ACHHY|nr:hypothetical protein ACHHYP_00719 [Achlya hypogyna]
MPLPYPLIEARFQMLDASIARMDSSKYTRLNATDALRETVRQHRKPSKRCSATLVPGPTPAKDKRSNQADVGSLTMGLVPVKNPLKVTPPAAFHSWGESRGAVADPKEARVHAVAKESWAAIEHDLENLRPFVPEPHQPLVPAAPDRSTKAKSAGLTRANILASSNSQLSANTPPHAEETPEATEVWQETVPVPRLRRPPATIRKPAAKLLVRCFSAGANAPVKPLRNWLNKTTTPRKPAPTPTPPPARVRNRPAKSPTVHSEKKVSEQLADYHDAMFYQLEIRLEHSSSLVGWTFRVIVTDITATDRPQILISNMACDDDHCILFMNPVTKEFSSVFNPLQYFDHVAAPIELYGHSLHIQVISESPVQKPIVDTYVHYMVSPEDAPPAELEPLQLEDETKTESPPCSTLDNSAYIYAHHFGPRESGKARSATKPSSPTAPKAPLSPFEVRKNELQRMRQSMRNELLREQERLSTSLR